MTTTDESPLANYFTATMDPLLGDPFGIDNAWDADLTPEEYGDQSGRWDNDNASFTDSDEDDDDLESQGSSCYEGEWSIVYAASFTVVASTSGSPTGCRASATSEGGANAVTAAPPAIPQPGQQARRDSKVRFCDEPPKVVSYECCSREEYSQLYYSVHELQKIIDEVRLEKKTTTPTNGGSSGHSNVTAASNNVAPCRSA